MSCSIWEKKQLSVGRSLFIAWGMRRIAKIWSTMMMQDEFSGQVSDVNFWENHLLFIFVFHCWLCLYKDFFFFRSLRLVIFQTFLVSKNLYGVAIMVEQCLVTCLCLSYWESRCVSYGDGFVTCFIATICNTSYVVYCLLYFSESVAISEWMMLQFIEFVM